MSNRDLLIDFFLFFRQNGENYVGHTIEQLVDIYLEENSKHEDNT